jgi:hypothetical protein
MSRPKRTAGVPGVPGARASRRGPFLLFVAAALLLAAGAAALVSMRGCARLTPAGAAAPTR